MPGLSDTFVFVPASNEEDNLPAVLVEARQGRALDLADRPHRYENHH